jgi:hypothetical protein
MPAKIAKRIVRIHTQIPREPTSRPLKNAMGGVDAKYACDDCLSDGIFGAAVLEIRLNDFGNDECDQGSL